MHVLVIEDELRMSALLHKGLSEHGHDVTVALDGAEGLKSTLDRDFDVILLDLGLPGLSGYDVAQVLQERRYPASILMLTAYNKEDEIVRGLNLGADDYLTKPFSFPELLARLRAVTRPSPVPAPTIFTIADLVVDTVQHSVTRRGKPINLTRTEYLLLELLAQNWPRVVGRGTLTEGIWREHKEVTPGALDVLVISLRSKLDAPFPTKLLHTVRGSGYQLKAQPSDIAGSHLPGYKRKQIK
jgi:two-component system copper resistance phosphate regulon response regulator CusR